MEGQAQDCLKAIEGQLLQGDPDCLFREVSINSRTVSRGALFVCIRGERFDGHDFLTDVIDKEAQGIILSDPKKLPDKTGQAVGKPFVIQVQIALARSKASPPHA